MLVVRCGLLQDRDRHSRNELARRPVRAAVWSRMKTSISLVLLTVLSACNSLESTDRAGPAAATVRAANMAVLAEGQELEL